MRRFDRIVNDESDASHADGDGIQAKEKMLSRLIERSLNRGDGGLFSDANFLGSSMRLGSGLDRSSARPPAAAAGVQDPASDSGADDLDVLDESNL